MSRLNSSKICGIAGIVPAAGCSKRMGQDKRQLRIHNKTMLEVTVDSLRHGGVDPIIVVLEPHSPCCNLNGLSDTILEVNPEPERGMLSSIRSGFKGVPDEIEAVAILPGDVPTVPSSIIELLVEEFLNHRPRLLVPRFLGRRGHPLFIARSLFSEALASSDEIGLRQFVWKYEDEVMVVDIELASAGKDIDSPEDWRRLLNSSTMIIKRSD